jgi:N,N-dimethylformamidase beta subunit-like, C-terminal
VLSTNTWQAYNFEDADGDGWGDSWYVSGRIRSVDLTRPFLDFGVPFRFGDWDLTVIAWMAATAKRVEFLSDHDLERLPSGDELARRYDLVVFPGHEEYATTHAYDVVTRYRDLGGNLIFLSANNFFWRVNRAGALLTKTSLWRNLGRPEAALVGVQYAGSNHGGGQKPYVVEGADALPWAFDGISVANGSTFGSSYGIEIDARAPSSPAGTVVLARVPDVVGPGRSGEMTYYETQAGAKVFAAGSLNFAASLDRPDVSRLVDNVWRRLAAP